MVDDALTDWLLDSDPALRWQVERDLLGASEDVWAATRARVATEGFGARLLALQDPDGQWAGGAFFPGGFDFEGPEAVEGAGQPWTATTWSLNSLREWGVDASVLTDTAERLAANSRWEYDDLPYWGGEVDCCINAWTLANGVWLSADVEGLAAWFVEHRMADGGWNCEWVEGSTRSSFHSTLNALKGLLAHEAATGGTDETRAARRAGEEYLLERGLMRRRSTGEAVAPWVTRFAYPFRWFYSVLNAADHFRAASRLHGTPPDPRMADAIEAIRAERQADGTWLQARRHRVECGSRSTCRRGSRRSGSPCPARASWSGGTRRRWPRPSRPETVPLVQVLNDPRGPDALVGPAVVGQVRGAAGRPPGAATNRDPGPSW